VKRLSIESGLSALLAPNHLGRTTARRGLRQLAQFGKIANIAQCIPARAVNMMTIPGPRYDAVDEREQRE
jgi:hypothetical protein